MDSAWASSVPGGFYAAGHQTWPHKAPLSPPDTPIPINRIHLVQVVDPPFRIQKGIATIDQDVVFFERRLQSTMALSTGFPAGTIIRMQRGYPGETNSSNALKTLMFLPLKGDLSNSGFDLISGN